MDTDGNSTGETEESDSEEAGGRGGEEGKGRRTGGGEEKMEGVALAQRYKGQVTPVKPLLKHKSASFPEEEPGTLTPRGSIVPSTTPSTHKLHPSPGSQHTRSVPPTTPPAGSSPAVGRKKLVYNTRPLSKTLYVPT